MCKPPITLHSLTFPNVPFSVNDGADAVIGGGIGGSISDELESNPDSDDHHLLLNNGSSSIHYGSHRYTVLRSANLL